MISEISNEVSEIIGKSIESFETNFLTCSTAGLCNPESFFEMIEKCKNCDKVL